MKSKFLFISVLIFSFAPILLFWGFGSIFLIAAVHNDLTNQYSSKFSHYLETVPLVLIGGLGLLGISRASKAIVKNTKPNKVSFYSNTIFIALGLICISYFAYELATVREPKWVFLVFIFVLPFLSSLFISLRYKQLAN